MRRLTRIPRLHLRYYILLLLLISCILSFTLLSYDNTLILLFRWHFHNALNATISKNDKWLSKPPDFPLEIDDVGFSIKTGFSTRERLVAQVDGLQKAHVRGNVVLVGDYSTISGGLFRNEDLGVPVRDVLDTMVESRSLSSRPDGLRLQYYSNLTVALSSVNFELARTIGEIYGWEMDIMKHISGLQLGYRLMPSKKWYVMLDDDTYIVNGSLKSILGRLNPSLPYYIGNAIGDTKQDLHTGVQL